MHIFEFVKDKGIIRGHRGEISFNLSVCFLEHVILKLVNPIGTKSDKIKVLGG